MAQMAMQRLPLPIFEPVHRLEPCRLGVSFGDDARDAPALEGDVLERLVNRLSANALAHRVGCRSVTALDRYVWDQLAKTSSIYVEREPTPYFTRLAAGSPPLRRAGTRGRPVRVLHDRLTVLGDAAEELWVAAKWVFHDFIHPLPVSSKRLALNDCELPSGGVPRACHRLMDISSADKRARAIREELRCGDLIAAVTRREGLTTDVASDGEAAIAYLRKSRYRVLVLDLMMPRLSGWEVIGWLQANPSFKPRTVIISTAADRNVLGDIDPDTVNAIFVKPFDVGELGAYVRACAELNAPRDRRRRRVIGQT